MRAKPKLGQNFLRDSHAIERIAQALGDIGSRSVVEIGPGAGAITELLAARAGRLLAVELDRNLAAALRIRFESGQPEQDRVRILEQDVLGFDFTQAAKEAGQPLLVVGNLPYYITSDILLHLASHHAGIERAVLMVQREVADRAAAQPGSRDYGLLSVTMQLYGSVHRLFTLPPEAFSPPPEVHSTVFRWSFAPRFAELGLTKPDETGLDETGLDETGLDETGPSEEPAAFFRFLRSAFAQKRKTLANNLRAAGWNSAAVQASLAKALGDTSSAAQVRAEALGLPELAAIWLALSEIAAASPA